MNLEGVLDGDLATILLAEESTDNRAFLFSQGVPGDVVGDGEEDERVQDDLELGATPYQHTGIVTLLLLSVDGFRRHDLCVASRLLARPPDSGGGWR